MRFIQLRDCYEDHFYIKSKIFRRLDAANQKICKFTALNYAQLASLFQVIEISSARFVEKTTILCETIYQRSDNSICVILPRLCTA